MCVRITIRYKHVLQLTYFSSGLLVNHSRSTEVPFCVARIELRINFIPLVLVSYGRSQLFCNVIKKIVSFLYVLCLRWFLPVDVLARPVLPLRSMYAYPGHGYMQASDTPVSYPHHHDVNPPLEVSTRLWVSLLSLLCEATCNIFQHCLSLHSHDILHR